MKRRTRLGRIPSMKQEPTDAMGALFGPHMHDSSQEVLDLLRKLEWNGGSTNPHGHHSGICPCCEGSKYTGGHKPDCELNKVLTGPGPRIAGHLVEQNQRLARELAEVQKQNAALQRHNTEQVELRRSAELELRQANLCLDCNRAEVSKLSAAVNELVGKERGATRMVKGQDIIIKALERDLGEVLEWSKGLYDLARHGMFLLAGHLEIYRSPVYPDPASLYDELHKHMTKDVAARVALHPLTKPTKKAKST